MLRSASEVVCAFWMAVCALAQSPTGTIAGVVRDPSGAAAAGAQVKLTSQATGFAWTAVTAEQGDFSFPSLLAGEYEVNVEAPGFQRMVRAATVEAGATTTTDFALRVGEVTESITVDAAAPQMHYVSPTVGGVITRNQIDDLPLNGRSFLELAKLEPGVQPPVRGVNNRIFVPVLGLQNGRSTLVTVDGGSIMAVGPGAASMGFSQEGEQGVQRGTGNVELSAVITGRAAGNVATRAGGHGRHGSAGELFRWRATAP